MFLSFYSSLSLITMAISSATPRRMLRIWKYTLRKVRGVTLLGNFSKGRGKNYVMNLINENKLFIASKSLFERKITLTPDFNRIYIILCYFSSPFYLLNLEKTYFFSWKFLSRIFYLLFELKGEGEFETMWGVWNFVLLHYFIIGQFVIQ